MAYKKLFTLQHIPYTYLTHRMTLNRVLSMHYMKRQEFHDIVSNYINDKLQNRDTMMSTFFDMSRQCKQFKFHFLFHPCPNTRRVDIDNFSYIEKITIDAVTRFLNVDDNYKNVVGCAISTSDPSDEEYLECIVYGK